MIHDDHADDMAPVTNVSWLEAQSYGEWLARKSGKKCRLPTEIEWQFAATSGGKDSDLVDEGQICDVGNIADLSQQFSWKSEKCNDCMPNGSASVRIFRSNTFGVYDMYGSVKEWGADCYLDSVNTYAKLKVHVAQSDFTDSGSAWIEKVIKGSGWDDGFRQQSFSRRSSNNEAYRSKTLCFRLVREL